MKVFKTYFKPREPFHYFYSAVFSGFSSFNAWHLEYMRNLKNGTVNFWFDTNVVVALDNISGIRNTWKQDSSAFKLAGFDLVLYYYLFYEFCNISLFGL